MRAAYFSLMGTVAGDGQRRVTITAVRSLVVAGYPITVRVSPEQARCSCRRSLGWLLSAAGLGEGCQLR